MTSTTGPNHKHHVGAAHTLAFLQAFASPGERVLDAGCGDGFLAKCLMDAGFKVTAIDTSNEAIEESMGTGVEAQVANFLEYKPAQRFDVILLSRSLHHMHPIEKAVEQAHSLLKEDGLMLLEDFGAELLDLKTAMWFYGLKALILETTKPPKEHGPKLEAGSIPQDPLKNWQDHHFEKHDVIPSSDILPVLPLYFDLIHVEQVPYLYRYLLDYVSHEQGQQIFDWEAALMASATITPIGIRAAGRKLTTDTAGADTRND